MDLQRAYVVGCNSLAAFLGSVWGSAVRLVHDSAALGWVFASFLYLEYTDSSKLSKLERMKRHSSAKSNEKH